MQLATAYCQCCRSERPLKKDGTFKQHKDYFNYGTCNQPVRALARSQKMLSGSPDWQLRR